MPHVLLLRFVGQPLRNLEDATESITRPGHLRIEEVDAEAILPQILALRSAALGRSISLTPDLSRWRDPHDGRASHWCVFHDAELVASARMSVHRSLDELTEGSLFRSLGERARFPLAVMSHYAVYSRYTALQLDQALDAARIERARQLQFSALLTVAENPTRAAALEALGFEATGVSGAAVWPRRTGLMLDLSRDLRDTVPARMRAPSRK